MCSHVQVIQDIPIVDVQQLTEISEEQQKLAEQIKDAFTSIGFAVIKNHNISEDMIEDVSEIVAQFFELPYNVKLKYKQDTSAKNLGWIELGKEVLYPPEDEAPAAADYKEGLNTGHKSSYKNWPSEIPGFKEKITAMIKELATLGNYIFMLMAKALHLEDELYFVKRHNLLSDANNTVLRFLNYPPIPEGGLVKGQMRCGEHTDWGSITLLIQDEYGGLEVQRRDGTWIETHPPKYTVMVNVADMMQRWTSDVFVSTNHRVREPNDDAKRRRTRRSMAYFVNTDDDVEVSCLDGSNKYPPIKASEYLWGRAMQHELI